MISSLLSAAQINNQLHPHPLAIYCFHTIDSTNEFLKTLTPAPSEPTLCLAETQTHGRGRFGRHWHSPDAENIYCSIRLKLPLATTALAGLSLVIGLSVIATLEACGIATQEIGLKWPNDLIWRQKKLGGILIELVKVFATEVDLIIGIGLNVNANFSPDPHQPWCALTEVTQTKHDRNQLIAKLVQQTLADIAEFSQTGLSSFMPKWQQFDDLDQQDIRIWHKHQHINGRAMGITADGALIVIDHMGITHYLTAGEASLHADPL